MTLIRAELCRYRLPFVGQFATARERPRDREGLLLRLTDDDGLVGLGEAAPLASFGGGTVGQALPILVAMAQASVGQRLETALPLEDLEGRRWWQLTDPYGGIAIRVRQPERNLLLPGGREVLVSAHYVRTEPTGPVRRVVVSLRDTEARRRTERSHAELIATVAHELRSPLTSVKGFTATLLAKWERFTDDQKRLMLETVDAAAHGALELLRRSVTTQDHQRFAEEYLQTLDKMAAARAAGGAS